MSRIALIVPVLSPASGGLATSVPALARVLYEHGCDAHILGLTDPNNKGAAWDWGRSVHAHDVIPPVAFGYAPDLNRTLRQLVPKIVHVNGLWVYPSLANLRHHRLTRTPYVITPHGMLDPWALERSFWKKRLVGFCFEDAHLRSAACLHATAEMEAGHFRSFGLRNPVAVVPNGIDLPSLLPDRPASGLRRMLFLSRLHPKKGIALLLQVWARLEAVYPDWTLVIAGPDEVGHKAEMQALANRLGLSRIEWHSAVQDAAKTALYRSADCFILPTHAENFGLVVAEALAHEVPVITTRNAPWEGLIAHGCGWWIALNESELSNSMSDAMARPRAELHAMGIRGRAWMGRDFGWDGVAERMIRLYNWVTHGGVRPNFVEID